MIVNATGTNAYQIAQKMIAQASDSSASGTDGTTGTGEASGGGFSGMVSEAGKTTMNTVRNAEQVSMDAMAGKASINEVVTAINSADIALKSVVAIRDKVIGAYQDIIKMPI